MAKGDLIVALDIGTTKICTLIAEVREGAEGAPEDRLEVVGIGLSPSTGVRRGVVVDIDQTAQAIRDSVEKAKRMAGAEIHSTIVGVTGEHISSLNSRGVIAITHSHREVTQEDLERVLESSRVIVLPPDREIIHALPRGYSIDGQNGIRSPVGMYGTRLEVETHIVTGATTFLRNVVTCVDRAGLHIAEMVLEPIGTAESVLLDAEKELGVALLDIGGGTADLAIFRGGDICYSAVIPVGGAYVTRDISVGLRVSLEEAERVKLAYGCVRTACAPGEPEPIMSYTCIGTDTPITAPVTDLAAIIEPRAEDILHLLQQEINRSGHSHHLPAGLVFSGGGALLPGLPQLATEITGLPTRVAHPRPVGGGVIDPVPSPALATGLGLLRWGARSHAPQRFRAESGGFLGVVTHYLRRFVRELLPR